MLDEYVIDSLKKFTWLKEPVETLNGIYNFFVDLNKKIENNDIKAKFIGMCLFDFVSKKIYIENGNTHGYYGSFM